MKHIALLDCNNFFVSCERLFRPDLQRRPVVVLSSNDGCVVARSQEIKDKGIPMGVPYFQIKDILQEMQAVVFSSHLALYRDISRRVLEVVRSDFTQVEQYSIDECFFSFESNEPLVIAAKLKERVEHLVGVPVSIGIAASKTQAKYASAVAKRTTGTSYLDAAWWEKESAGIALSEIWGVGSRRSRQFKDTNLLTVADLRKEDRSRVARLFGVEGVRLQAELNGQAVHQVQSTKADQKTIMSTRSFAKTTTSLSVLSDAVNYHLYEAVKDLEAQQLLTTGVRVLIAPSRHSDYALYRAAKEAIVPIPTKDLFVLQQVVQGLLQECYEPDIPYKKAGVVLFGLRSAGMENQTLFSDSEAVKAEQTKELSSLLFTLNRKLGGRTIQLGRIERETTAWATKREALSPAYTTNWNDLKVVKTG